MLETLHSAATRIDNNLPVLWVVLGLLACEVLSRVLNRADQHSPERSQGRHEECPHCTACRHGGRFGTPCSMA
jgi:hypothetical protein